MARKRMFDLEIINQDSFLDLPMESKAIYFLLGMEADDEGFVAPKKVLRLYGGTEDSLKILIAKNFIIPFSTGVIVITDWKRNNWLDSRRIKNTIYQEEKTQITYNPVLEKYEFNGCSADAKQLLSENRIEENRIEENSIVVIDQKTTTTKFKKPSLEEVKEYCQERNNNINAEQFIDYYDANGWKVGKNSMKDWKAAIRTWERNRSGNNEITSRSNTIKRDGSEYAEYD